MDIWTEKSNDAYENEQREKNGIEYVATQADFDKF